jgi:polysaccharide pyruvyl transferase WcaK-like protein
VNIKGFCFHNSVFEDYAHTCECFDRSGLNPNDVIVPDLDFQAACARLSDFDAIISSRFHAIVVGNAMGISTFAVCDGEYYDRKMEAATKNFERSALIKQFDCAPEQVAFDILHNDHAPSHKEKQPSKQKSLTGSPQRAAVADRPTLAIATSP